MNHVPFPWETHRSPWFPFRGVVLWPMQSPAFVPRHAVSGPEPLAWDWPIPPWSWWIPPWSFPGCGCHGRASHIGMSSYIASFLLPSWPSTVAWCRTWDEGKHFFTFHLDFADSQLVQYWCSWQSARKRPSDWPGCLLVQLNQFALESKELALQAAYLDFQTLDDAGAQLGQTVVRKSSPFWIFLVPLFQHIFWFIKLSCLKWSDGSFFFQKKSDEDHESDGSCFQPFKCFFQRESHLWPFRMPPAPAVQMRFGSVRPSVATRSPEEFWWPPITLKKKRQAMVFCCWFFKPGIVCGCFESWKSKDNRSFVKFCVRLNVRLVRDELCEMFECCEMTGERWVAWGECREMSAVRWVP